MGFPNPKSTATPSPEEIQYCRDVMYINPDLDIEPLGFSLQSGMDDVIRFKFLAKTDDPSKIFDATHVDSAKFKSDFGVYALDPDAKDDWWDVSSQTLVGGNFTVPPPKSQGTRGLNIGFTENDNSTLTIYVLWHET
ncbi:hypothetical protein Mal52_44870 [Symmachiella dynata]|uniref:Uncharacterized protein n=1 Tax=Symmachiella dynata TaxID=2527995 RepID=A0A517ZU59_9PLAN|nr:hypothetical protein [Symmachiella dynata]QDU45990.1 hypothetical protein Mal52_44870 [Symmachiella dynata]